MQLDPLLDQNWPLIGQNWSRDLDTGPWLARKIRADSLIEPKQTRPLRAYNILTFPVTTSGYFKLGIWHFTSHRQININTHSLKVKGGWLGGGPLHCFVFVSHQSIKQTRVLNPIPALYSRYPVSTLIKLICFFMQSFLLEVVRGVRCEQLALFTVPININMLDRCQLRHLFKDIYHDLSVWHSQPWDQPSKCPGDTTNQDVGVKIIFSYSFLSI